MLILTLFLREYSIERKTIRSDEAKAPGDLEQGRAEQSLRMTEENSKDQPTNTVAEPEEEVKAVTGNEKAEESQTLTA